MKPILVEDDRGLSFALIAENGYVNPIVHARNLGVIRVVGYSLYDREKLRALTNAANAYPSRVEELTKLATANNLTLKL